MADFCLRCCLDMYWGPTSDFDHFGKDGTITEADVAAGKGILVLCEGCGPTYVDHLGRCLGGCDEQHMPPGDDEVLRRHGAWLARRSGPLGRLYRLWDWWDGTAWQPGMKHELRHRWHTRHIKDDDFDFLDYAPALDQGGSDGAILRSGDTPDAQGRGPAVDDLHPGPQG